VGWVLIIALSLVAVCVSRWVVEGSEDRSGPLYWIAGLLTLLLLGLAIYMAYLQKQGPIPTWSWLVVAGLFAVVLVLRRALKWRP
jgi:hypothetical protein